MSMNGERRRLTPLWAVAGAVILLLLAGAVWLLVSSKAQQATAAPPAVVVTPTPQPTVFSTPTPGATKPVPKPRTRSDVPIDEAAPPVKGATVTVTDVTSVSSVGKEAPGQIVGPGVKVRIRIANRGSAALDTSGANVTLTYGDDRTPAVAAINDPAQKLWPESIAAGESATGTFLFVIPSAAKGDIRVTVDLLAAEPDIVFVGPRPR